MSDFAQELRAENSENWNAAVQHRFVEEIFRGSVSPEVMRRYLIQDYQFIDRFTALIGAAIASADRFSSRIRFARFAAMIVSDENTYFQRAFDALDVPQAERDGPVLSPETTAFQALMQEAARSLDYASCLAVLNVAEGLYLDWADQPGRPLPRDFVHAEWITLHNNEGFRDFVGWLRSELDRVGGALNPERAAPARAFFRRAVELERAFFDHVYS
ncbi:TenA family protein [Ancylobacter sp. 6x-1]|uniref:Aminopyrimidine aminohydrolase n=1 Tax=Ancylobacter crimeensis TaxID=2579147 RepID=A0ABT0DBH6_9HYPH|nr:TenA family protein [Ancylobacter crimeensis]MCK0197224.1 TenA family protein [Ancylobacter crimeensis]